MPTQKTKKKTTKTKGKTRKAASKKSTAVKKKAAIKKTAAKKTLAARTPKRQATRKPAVKKKRKVSFKKEIAEELLAAKQRLLSEVYHKVKSGIDVSKSEIGDIYDIASRERERELSLTLGDRERGKLEEIEGALERIEDNSYDICEECGEPIGENRLRALPFTRVCVDCKSRSEREELVKGRGEERAAIGMMERADIEEEEF
jgi:DnaK suppressor protein